MIFRSPQWYLTMVFSFILPCGAGLCQPPHSAQQYRALQIFIHWLSDVSYWLLLLTARCHKHSDGSPWAERVVWCQQTHCEWPGFVSSSSNPATEWAIPEKKNKTGAIISHLISVKEQLICHAQKYWIPCLSRRDAFNLIVEKKIGGQFYHLLAPTCKEIVLKKKI